MNWEDRVKSNWLHFNKSPINYIPISERRVYLVAKLNKCFHPLVVLRHVKHCLYSSCRFHHRYLCRKNSFVRLINMFIFILKKEVINWVRSARIMFFLSDRIRSICLPSRLLLRHDKDKQKKRGILSFYRGTTSPNVENRFPVPYDSAAKITEQKK